MYNMSLASRKEVATKLRLVAKQQLARDLEMWKGEPEMVAMTRADKADMREVAKLLVGKDGQRLAANKMSSMDTAARDAIPSSIYYTILGDD